MSPSDVPRELIDRRVEDAGRTVELYRRGEAYDLVIEGQPAGSSDVRRSEKSLVELTLAPLAGRDDVAAVLVGLGFGYTLRALLDSPGVKRVDVVEGSPAIADWAERFFAALNGDALKDPRVTLHRMDLSAFLKHLRLGGADLAPDGWLALVLDAPASPFHSEEGLERLEAALRPGGVLATWSVQRDMELFKRLHARFQNVAEVVVPVELPDKMVMDYVYRGRRHPPPQDPKKTN